MKNIVNQYKEEFKNIIKDKAYMFSIIITAILGYGYFVTHCTIGIDDTCLDRYYGSFFDVNIISIVGRWGSYFLYKILNIKTFTPLWLETISILVFIITAILISCFIRKNMKSKNKLITIIFSCIYISYSLINEPLIFQPSNLAILVGNLLTIISVILIYEMFEGKYNKKNYLLISLILTIGISMYESCCQTFLIALSFIIMYDLIIKKKNDKQLFKKLLVGIGILVLSIALNYIILYTFYFIGVPNELDKMAGEKQINWSKYGLIRGINIVFENIKNNTIYNVQYFPILEFVIANIIGIILSTYYSIKNKNINILVIYMLLALSNIAIAILQCDNILYRTCTSWSLFVAGVFTTTYVILYKNKHLKNIALMLAILIILWQTKDLNQWFYSEHIKYQRDLNDAYQIANDIKKEVEDITKPIVFVGFPHKGFQTAGQVGAQSNGLSVVWWGYKAFDDNSYELIRFINSLGYSFFKPTDEQYQRGKELSKGMSNYPKDGYIKEIEDIIIIKFD